MNTTMHLFMYIDIDLSLLIKISGTKLKYLQNGYVCFFTFNCCIPSLSLFLWILQSSNKTFCSGWQRLTFWLTEIHMNRIKSNVKLWSGDSHNWESNDYFESVSAHRSSLFEHRDELTFELQKTHRPSRWLRRNEFFARINDADRCTSDAERSV